VVVAQLLEVLVLAAVLVVDLTEQMAENTTAVSASMQDMVLLKQHPVTLDHNMMAMLICRVLVHISMVVLAQDVLVHPIMAVVVVLVITVAAVLQAAAMQPVAQAAVLATR
jgi:hypothetical protein